MKDAGVWIQFGGVNSEAKNKPGATLYSIWNAYDPDWITARLTTEALNTSAVPFPGSAQLDARPGHGPHQAECGRDVRGCCDRPVGDHREPGPVEPLINDANNVMYQ